MARIQGDLKDRTFEFARAILEMSDQFPNNTKGWVVSKQLTRSGTAIGSNVWEADHALTDAEFAQRCSVARKEASETEFWLRLSAASGILPSSSTVSLITETDELLRILSTIVLKTQQAIQREKARE